MLQTQVIQLPVATELLEGRVQQLVKCNRINGTEAQIIKNELNSQRLCTFTENELYNVLIDIWSEVKVLTGAIMYSPPEEEGKPDMLELQYRVLKKFIMSSHRFMQLTKNEVLHAFYLNDTGAFGDIIRHYNKELNSEFVGSVLDAYARYKLKMYDRSHYEIKKALYPPTPPPPFELTEDMLKSLIQSDYENYLKGEWDMIFNTTPKYLYLRKIGAIQLTSISKFAQWYQQAVQYRFNQIRGIKGRAVFKQEKTGMYKRIQEEGIIPIPEHRAIIHTARRLIYLKFFEILKATAIASIFTEISFNQPKKRN